MHVFSMLVPISVGSETESLTLAPVYDNVTERNRYQLGYLLLTITYLPITITTQAASLGQLEFFMYFVFLIR
jgi:hypothetical protein